MNKKLIIGVAVGFAVAVSVATAKKSRGEAQPTIFEKLQQCMERMPEDFPPRVMFDNVEATKANTEEILTLLQHENSAQTDTWAMASA